MGNSPTRAATTRRSAGRLAGGGNTIGRATPDSVHDTPTPSPPGRSGHDFMQSKNRALRSRDSGRPDTPPGGYRRRYVSRRPPPRARFYAEQKSRPRLPLESALTGGRPAPPRVGTGACLRKRVPTRSGAGLPPSLAGPAPRHPSPIRCRRPQPLRWVASVAVSSASWHWRCAEQARANSLRIRPRSQPASARPRPAPANYACQAENETPHVTADTYRVR